jgi:hypothetical protein
MYILPPIYLIVGPPAVGKSSTSRELAARFPRSLYVPVDDLRTMVVAGLRLPAAEWSDELAQQITLARDTACHMALTYHAAGFAVIIDDFWDANHSADYHALLAHPDLRRVVLYPQQDEAHRRNFNRSGGSPARTYIDEGISIVYRQLNPVIAQLAQDGWLVLDTTALDVGATVESILGL